MKPKAVLFDLDNCLALLGDRDPYAGHLCHTDTLCPAVAFLLHTLDRAGNVHLLILTGRNESARDATHRWLTRHHLHADAVYMRAVTDWRPAADYKADVLTSRILPRYDVLFALDDDPAVIAAMRALGLAAWQVRDYVPYTRDRQEVS
jgi:FMN phosphatase YigB (HAD superfamily)